MDTNIKCELKKDFQELLGNIDFNSYNPNSQEFKNALNIGLMLHIIPDEIEKHNEIENIEKDEISEELADAKKYLQKYIDSNDSIFQQMTNDELKHAEILIKKAYSKLPNAEEKTKLKSYEDEINQIKSNID